MAIRNRGSILRFFGFSRYFDRFAVSSCYWSSARMKTMFGGRSGVSAALRCGNAVCDRYSPTRQKSIPRFGATMALGSGGWKESIWMVRDSHHDTLFTESAQMRHKPMVFSESDIHRPSDGFLKKLAQQPGTGGCSDRDGLSRAADVENNVPSRVAIRQGRIGVASSTPMIPRRKENPWTDENSRRR